MSEVRIRILHVMVDEKFNDMAIRQFEAVSNGLNQYCVLADKAIHTKSPLITLCSIGDVFEKINNDRVAVIVFHGMPVNCCKFLSSIPKGKTVVWIGWGYDYYHLMSDKQSLLVLPKTKELRPLKTRFRQIFKSFIRKNIPSRFLPIQRYLSNLKRVDIFSPVLDLEFQMVSPVLSSNVKYIEWNYGTVEDDLQLQTLQSAAFNVLAGNSASETNNHVELFRLILDQVDLSNRRVIVPLSYGDKEYGQKVVKIGKDLLGDSFVPLLDYLPKKEYMKMLSSCGFFVMNHTRQQAVSNVCMAMLMGAKVYLNPLSPLTAWLLQRGAVIGDVRHLDMQELTDAEKDKNRAVVRMHWGRDVQLKKTRRLLYMAMNGDANE